MLKIAEELSALNSTILRLTCKEKEEMILQTSLQANTGMEVKHG
jgi:hypothetical protein